VLTWIVAAHTEDKIHCSVFGGKINRKYIKLLLYNNMNYL